MLLSSNIPVSANNNFIVLDNYKIKYNEIIYDLSTKEDNLRFTENNRNLSVAEYFNILDVVFDSNDVVEENDTLMPLAQIPNDPGGGIYNYHSKMEWFYRSKDGWNLGVVPNSFPRQSLNEAVIGWKEVVEYQSSKSYWSNEASLRGQYLCHFWFANSKEQWNIAPSIPNKNAFEWIGDRCN